MFAVGVCTRCVYVSVFLIGACVCVCVCAPNMCKGDGQTVWFFCFCHPLGQHQQREEENGSEDAIES